MSVTTQAFIDFITGLTADTSPSSDDLVFTVNAPGGTAANRKVTIANLFANAPNVYTTTVTATNITGVTNMQTTNISATLLTATTVSATDVKATIVTATTVSATTISATGLIHLYKTVGTNSEELFIGWLGDRFYVQNEWAGSGTAQSMSIYAGGLLALGSSDMISIAPGDTGGSWDFYPTTCNMLPSVSGSFSIGSSANTVLSIFVDNVKSTTISATTVSATTISAYGYNSEFLPIAWAQDGTVPPATKSTFTCGAKVDIRDFAGAVGTEDVLFNWHVPYDTRTVSNSGMMAFRVHWLITNATGPSAEGVAFTLSAAVVSGTQVLHNTPLAGKTQIVTQTALTQTQGTDNVTSWSSEITATGLSAGALAILTLSRPYDNENDTYAQDIGVFGLEVKYGNNLHITS